MARGFAIWVVLLAMAAWLPCASPAAQLEFGVNELAEYRLGAVVFVQFDRASRLIGAAMRADPRFERAPLFTEEVMLSGDVLPMAVALDARLRNEPALADALRTANITSHEYTKFALVLFAARLAHGFIEAGALRTVSTGVHGDNVMFVAANQIAIEAVMKELGLD